MNDFEKTMCLYCDKRKWTRERDEEAICHECEISLVEQEWQPLFELITEPDEQEEYN